MEDEKIKLVIRIIGISILIVIGVYILSYNYPLFGLTIILKEKEVSGLSPNTRVKKVLESGSEAQKQFDDFVYFTTKSEGFDKAVIKLSFLNSSPEQEIQLGFKDRAEWHYLSKPLFLPLIESLNWNVVNSRSPSLYQRVSNLIRLRVF